MPIHEYTCPACGHREDHLIRMAETPPVHMPCPRCGETARRVIGHASLIDLKGSGYYQSGPSPVKSKR